VRFTDTESYLVSEASVCRLLRTLDLIAGPPIAGALASLRRLATCLGHGASLVLTQTSRFYSFITL
jgi:hypothetical protein